jgi:hypothetical protein
MQVFGVGSKEGGDEFVGGHLEPGFSGKMVVSKTTIKIMMTKATPRSGL